MQETVEERLARIEALLMEVRANQNILMTARTTPSEALLAEKLQVIGSSVSAGDVARLCVRSRQHAYNLMTSLADKEPDKYRYRAGDPATKRASRLIRISGPAKLIDFASLCASQSRISLNQLAKDHGLEFEEVREQATIFCQTLERKYRPFFDEKGNGWIVKA
jgi:hypothetical protein